MALGADYSFELIFNETCVPQFNGHNNYFLASVNAQWVKLFYNKNVSIDREVSAHMIVKMVHI